MSRTSVFEKNCRVFSDFYSSHGYSIIEPVGISSGIDKSVYLVNSATNLFKPSFSQTDVCICAVQPCMRTQALNDFYNEEVESEYPTCFVSFGAYASKETIDKLFIDTFEYLKILGFLSSSLRIRVSAADDFLIEYAKAGFAGVTLFTDDRFAKYEHKYGDNITGRVVKIDCYQDFLKRYKNICYLIAIYKDGLLCGAEFASSCQQIVLRCSNALFGIAVSPIADILPTGTFNQRRFADCVVAVSNLCFENVRPNSSNTNGRTMKKYLKAISHFGKLENRSSEDIIECLKEYAGSVFGDHSNRMFTIFEKYIQEYYF